MLASLRGRVCGAYKDRVLLDVNGLGFELYASREARNICEDGEVITLLTVLQMSESGAVIFAFGNELERTIFKHLVSVKGIGGKLALTILQTLTPREVIRSVLDSDVVTLIRVPGIGKRTSERICFELHRKISAELALSEDDALQPCSVPVMDTVVEALRSLGFQNQEVLSALGNVQAKHKDDLAKLDEEHLIMDVLRELNAK